MAAKNVTMSVCGYTPGSIASLISGKKIETEQAQSTLFKKFVNKAHTVKEKKVTKQKPSNNTSRNKKDGGLADKQTVFPDRKKMREKIKEEKRLTAEKNRSTVFVGNLPITTNKKQLKEFFQDCGAVNTMRFRSVAPANPKMPKKGVVASGNFHPKMHSLNAYVEFKEEASIAKALKLNGALMEDHHVRVDALGQEKKHDHKRSIFIGNLPFDVQDDDVYEHFKECGDIENVRIIRDKFSRVGKGFGYILFKDKDSVSLSTKIRDKTFKGRILRIEPSTEPKSTQSPDTNMKPRKRKLEVEVTPRKPKKKNEKHDDNAAVNEARKLKTRKEDKEKRKKKLKHRLDRKQKKKIGSILMSTKKTFT